MTSKQSNVAELDILTRVFQLDPDHLTSATADTARVILQLRFPQADQDRMHDLVVRNQNDELTDAEKAEMASYRKVGRMLDVLAARARQTLKRLGKKP